MPPMSRFAPIHVPGRALLALALVLTLLGTVPVAATAALTSITITPSTAQTIVVGQTLQFKAVDQNNIDITASVTWNISPSSYFATFSTSTPGLLTGVHNSSPSTGGTVTASSGSVTSNPVSVTVNQADTTTAVFPNKNPVPAGQSVTLTARVTAKGPGAGVPTGTVNFFDSTHNNKLNNAPVALLTVNGKQEATLTVTTGTTGQISPGTVLIVAQYSGDTDFNTSSGPCNLTVSSSGGGGSPPAPPDPSAPGVTFPPNTANLPPILSADPAPYGSIDVTHIKGDPNAPGYDKSLGYNPATYDPNLGYDPTLDKINLQQNLKTTLQFDPGTDANGNPIPAYLCVASPDPVTGLPVSPAILMAVAVGGPNAVVANFLASGKYTFSLLQGTPPADGKCPTTAKVLQSTVVQKQTPDGTANPSIVVFPAVLPLESGIYAHIPGPKILFDGGTGTPFRVCVNANNSTTVDPTTGKTKPNYLLFSIASYGAIDFPYFVSGTYHFKIVKGSGTCDDAAIKTADVVVPAGAIVNPASPSGGSAPNGTTVQVTVNTGDGTPALACVFDPSTGKSQPVMLGGSGAATGPLNGLRSGDYQVFVYTSADGSQITNPQTGQNQCTANVGLRQANIVQPINIHVSP